MKKNHARRMNWKRIFYFSIIIFFLVLLVFMIWFYNQIKASKTGGFMEVEALVLEGTIVSSVDEVFYFQGDKAYFILYGRDAEDKKWIVFNEAGNQDPNNMLLFAGSDLFTGEEIERFWQANCANCHLKNSGPAMLNKTPLWEITYLDESNRYVMEYISLLDQKVYEKLILQLKYNMKG